MDDFPPERDIWPPETFVPVPTAGMTLAFGGQKPGIQINTLQCTTGQAPINRIIWPKMSAVPFSPTGKKVKS